jgi:hypothetical protein
MFHTNRPDLNSNATVMDSTREILLLQSTWGCLSCSHCCVSTGSVSSKFLLLLTRSAAKHAFICQNSRLHKSWIRSIVKESLLRDVQRVVPGVGIQRIHERAGQKKVFFFFVKIFPRHKSLSWGRSGEAEQVTHASTKRYRSFQSPSGWKERSGAAK